MRLPYTQLYVHCVWSTWDRLPLITPDVEVRVYGCILSKCRELRCEPLAIGGIEDHVHLLVRFPPALEISRLVKDVKGTSSHLMTHELRANIFFKWQGAYGAFTVSKPGVSKVREYIKGQKAHHSQGGTLIDEWERCDVVEEAL